MDNYYHHLAKKPAMVAKKMPKGLEDLARILVESGKFRVDTIRAQNFVRWTRPFEGINRMFSNRELLNPDLIPRTKKIMRKVFARTYKGDKLTKKINEELTRMQHEAEKNLPIPHEVELALARLIVQSAEPAVIMLIIAEGAEVFVSYSYNVADMLDIQTWQEAGDSSGLQSTERSGCSIFVSAGGNPLIPEKKIERPTDGFHALSRLVVIAGQELAHYADIVREGRNKGARFSADWEYGRATEVARIGRLKDRENVFKIYQQLLNIGLRFVAREEGALKFFKEHRKWQLITLYTKIKVLIMQAVFIMLMKSRGFNYLKSFYKDAYMCSQLTLMLEDMLVNLQPEADAYKRHDPVEEEMIMCIEALARVQQQSNKWGREVTKKMYPHLYDLYYKEVIPSCIRVVERVTGQAFPEYFRRY